MFLFSFNCFHITHFDHIFSAIPVPPISSSRPSNPTSCYSVSLFKNKTKQNQSKTKQTKPKIQKQKAHENTD